MLRSACLVVCASLLAACASFAPPPDPAWDDIATLQARMAAGALSATQLTERFLARIDALDDRGPTLRAVVEINPDALALARELDAERAAGRVRGPLHGIPVLLKDNIDTGDRMLTTAGSFALVDSRPADDAFVVARLRAAGAVILGKTNLSEWANFRSTRATSGWSARGGQTRNPYGRERNPCGSSAGSAVAVAVAMTAVAVGTETNGSITCPASATGVVGMKPTVGLVSRDGIVPISISQDSAGPLARSVADAAALLQAMAAWDADDPAAAPVRRIPDFGAALDADALTGARIGIARSMAGFDAATDALFERALGVLRAAGATLVEVELKMPAGFNDDAFTVLLHEFRAGIDAYLATRDGPPRTLPQLIAFNRAHAALEMPHFGQEIFLLAAAVGSLDDPAYRDAYARSRRAARADGIDRTMREHALDAIVAPTMAPAWRTDYARGDDYRGGGASAPPAVAGYPHITLPMGDVDGLPVGLSFFAGAYSDARLLGFAYAYEQRAGLRMRPVLAE
ncbi:MAG: amidase [Pseudomonadota bacterium]